MEGNPICPQIPWGEDPEKLAAWTEARTGFPFIDAIMIQLREEGWVHHLARHAVACFLTRGDLWIHWERGMQVFEKYLIDYDWSINSSNWMWLSSSAFFLPIYSPVAFGKKTDPSGAYIRKYLPRLARYPDKYVYEPWTAPLEVQEEAGCIIGEDYPYPIVDHETASKENIARMNRAYDAAKLEDSDNKDKRKSGSSEVEEEEKDNKIDPTDKKKMKLDSFWKKFEVVPGGQPAKA